MDVYWTLVWNIWPLVLFFIEICHVPVSAPCSSIETVIESPGTTASDTCCDAAGSISIQVWN
ncbi:MAG: hypothetical protein M3150_02630 [Pseudomonadota bacterium]|nr:hypothetical protein [Pseudomonadota bacterium]